MTDSGKKDPAASGTAGATAFMRALAASDPREHIRGGDNLAEAFLTDEERIPLRDPAARAWLLENKVAAGAYAFMIARTAFFDEVVEGALRENVPQIVFLGAGYDSRPYRFRELIQDTAIFELDTEATLRRKQACLGRAQISIPAQVRFAPFELPADDLMLILVQAGFKRNGRTLFLWEGVTYYLSGEIVDSGLTAIGRGSPAGSSICFDYAALSGEALQEKGAVALRDHMRTEHPNEPAKFGIRAGEIGSVLGNKGFEIREHLTAAKMQERYLPGVNLAEIGKIPALFCLVWARVK